MKSSNASSAAFGWDFQSNAAIMIMLKNIRTASAVKVEGATEDIEITLNNEKVIFSQAKSVFKPDDYSNVRAKMQAGLKTLNEAGKMSNIEKLIYVTNSPNPFNDTETMWAFSGGLTLLKYIDLPDICKKKIDEICKAQNFTFERNLFSVYVMQFHGDEDNRYKILKELTNEFLDSIGVGDRGLGTKMLDIWQRSFSVNASQHDQTRCISKREMIWPLIVLICGIDSKDAILADCDDGESDEICRRYNAIINNNSERFEFLTKVLSAYNNYLPSMKSRERVNKFIEAHWSNFQSEFEVHNMETDILETIIKLTVGNVLKRRSIINDVKKEVGL